MNKKMSEEEENHRKVSDTAAAPGNLAVTEDCQKFRLIVIQ